MKDLRLRKTIIKAISIVCIATSLMFLNFAYAQEQRTYSEIEELQDKNMDYINQIHEITSTYPAFSFEYVMEDGKAKKVIVKGVSDKMETKKLEVMLLDLKSNQNMLKSKANRMGVFYYVDEKAKYKNGEDAFESDLINNLKYPEKAKNWGVEGTVYVKFVIDEDGYIPFATTSTNIDASIDAYVEDLENQAVSAVKETSGDWKPAKINGVEVSSLAVVPVTFDFEKDPSIRALIY